MRAAVKSDRAKEHVRELQRVPHPFRSAHDRGEENEFLPHPLPPAGVRLATAVHLVCCNMYVGVRTFDTVVADVISDDEKRLNTCSWLPHSLSPVSQGNGNKCLSVLTLRPLRRRTRPLPLPEPALLFKYSLSFSGTRYVCGAS